MLIDEFDGFVEISRQVVTFMIFARNVFVIRDVSSTMIEVGTIGSRNHSFNVVSTECFWILCCLEVADVDATHVIMIWVRNTLDVFGID